MTDIAVEFVIQEAQSMVVEAHKHVPARFFFHVTLIGPNRGSGDACPILPVCATVRGFTLQWWNKKSCWDRETKTLSLGGMKWFGLRNCDVTDYPMEPIDVDDILSIVPRTDFREAFNELARNIDAVTKSSYPIGAIDLLEDCEPPRVIVAFKLQEAHDQITQKTIEEPADIWFNIVGLDPSRLAKVTRPHLGRATDSFEIVFDFIAQSPPTDFHIDGLSLNLHAFGWVGAETTEKLRSLYLDARIRVAFTELAANMIRAAQGNTSLHARAKPPPRDPEVYVLATETSVELVRKRVELAEISVEIW